MVYELEALRKENEELREQFIQLEEYPGHEDMSIVRTAQERLSTALRKENKELKEMFRQMDERGYEYVPLSAQEGLQENLKAIVLLMLPLFVIMGLITFERIDLGSTLGIVAASFIMLPTVWGCFAGPSKQSQRERSRRIVLALFLLSLEVGIILAYWGIFGLSGGWNGR